MKSSFYLVTLVSSSEPQRPIIVRIIEPAKDPTGIAHIIVQAIGFTGAVALLAVLLGLVLAAVMVWVRSRGA